MSVGPFSFDDKATTAQKDVIRPALQQANAVVGPLLKPIVLVPKTAGQMPKWNGVNPAWGLWKGWVKQRQRREIWYWNELHLQDECGPTILHEVMHALDDMWLTNSQRADMMELMAPQPGGWSAGGDPAVWGRYPFEVYAVWGSAVLFNLVKPPYVKYLKRKIALADRDPDPLRSIILRDDGPAEAAPLAQPIGGT